MIDRITLIIKIKNLTASKFADEIRVQRSSISHILSGRNKPSLELIQKILKKYPDIRTDWLLNGIGQITKVADIEKVTQTSIFDDDEKVDENYLDDDISQINPKSAHKIPDNKQIEENKIEENIKKLATNSSESSTFTKKKSVERIVIFFKDKTFQEYTIDD